MMLTIQNPLQYIDIVQHDNHFYEFIFKQGGLNTWEEWFICLEQLYQLPPETKVKIIVDTTKCHGLGLSNVIYLGRYLVRKYPNRPKPIRIVFLDSEKTLPMARLLQTIVSTMNAGDKTNHSYSDNRDKAVDFLFNIP
jgi:hypothetical protein